MFTLLDAIYYSQKAKYIKKKKLALILEFIFNLIYLLLFVVWTIIINSLNIIGINRIESLSTRLAWCRFLYWEYSRYEKEKRPQFEMHTQRFRLLNAQLFQCTFCYEMIRLNSNKSYAKMNGAKTPFLWSQRCIYSKKHLHQKF